MATGFGLLPAGAIAAGSGVPVFPGPTVTPAEFLAVVVADGFGTLLFATYLSTLAARWHGQTLGKRALGIRIATLDGGVPTAGAFAARASLYFGGAAALLVAGIVDRQTSGPGEEYVFFFVVSLVLVVAEIAVLAAAVTPDRRSLLDRYAGTVVVLGSARQGSAVTGQVAVARQGELAWFVPVLLVCAVAGVWGESVPYTQAAGPGRAETAGARAVPTAADDAAISALSALEKQVERCLARGDGPNSCADPALYRASDLRFAPLPDGVPMAFNPGGRYAGQVAINAEGDVIGLYAYTARRVWWLETGDPDQRGCALPVARSERGDWPVCGDGFAWPSGG